METKRLIEVLNALKIIEYKDYCYWDSELDKINEEINNLDTYENLERFVDLIELKSLTKLNVERQQATYKTIQLIIDYIENGCHSHLYTLKGEQIEKIIRENENA